MCDERERLIGFVYDECDADERQTIEEHLESCSTCRKEISGLRDVREDLLAWRVPLHEPVWRPLPVAAPMLPWWRQVPAWALAAAAGVMFISGLAGGALAAAWLPRASALTAEQREMHQSPVVTPVDLTQAEQRILQLMRRELSGMNQKVELVSTPAPARVVTASFPTGLVEQVRGLETSTEERDRRLLEVITQTSNDFALRQKRLREELLAEIRTTVLAGGGQLNK
jgi:hypothetical protein